MNNPKLVVNMAKCLRCGYVISSKHPHDYNSCQCKALAVDGGTDYTRRVYSGTRADWEELSLYENDSFVEIRKHLKRGSRGKSGVEDITWIALKDIDDDYLHNLIDYMEEERQTDNIHYQMYLKEVSFREGYCL